MWLSSNPEIDSEAVSAELHRRAEIVRKDITDHVKIREDLKKSLKPATSDQVYRLAITDVFVEKAIHLLKKQATAYKWIGYAMFFVAFCIIALGAYFAGMQANIWGGVNSQLIEKQIRKEMENNSTVALYTHFNFLKKIDSNESVVVNTSMRSTNAQPHIVTENIIKELISREITMAWIESLMMFMKSFTFYGLLVLTAVKLIHFGKAILDQSERLSDRKHALRQGRLYLHLKKGEIASVDELEKAFNWNHSQNNAFAGINPDAMAPWGNVIKEMLNTFPKMAEATNKK